MIPSKFHLIAFTLFVCLFGCQKELSFSSSNNSGIPSDSAAVFALVPASGNCSDALASGVFEVGKALASDAKITLTLAVSKIGLWKYSTININGFTFSGSGRFTSTGPQTITLKATGTPTTAGNFSVPLNMNNSACSTPVLVMAAPSGGGGGSGSALYYYKATIAGANYSQDVTATNGYEPGSGSAGVDNVSFGGGIVYANPPVPAGFTELGVEKGLMNNYLTATDARFKSFFAPGNYPYSPNFSASNGVRITWLDPVGEYWDTQMGTADQTGSTFKIVSVTDAYDAAGNYYVRVKMEFTCKLYNISSGAMKQLTNGELVALFGKL